MNEWTYKVSFEMSHFTTQDFVQSAQGLLIFKYLWKSQRCCNLPPGGALTPSSSLSNFPLTTLLRHPAF